MKSGKVSDTVLNRSVLSEVAETVPEALCPRVGGGAAQGFYGDLVSAVQTVTDEGVLTAYLAAVKAVNSLAAAQATPKFADLAITVPEDLDERDLRKMTERACTYLAKQSVAVTGGHTAVSRCVSAPIVSVRMLGIQKTKLAQAGTETADWDVVMTKQCGFAGTALLAGHYKELLTKRYPERFIERAAGLLEKVGNHTECAIAAQQGAVYAHAAGEGGIFGALWELAEYMKCGLEIDLDAIPILQETVEICEVFDINPYQLKTEGVFLFLTRHGARLCEMLAAEQIPAAVIGKTVAGPDRAVRCRDEVRYLEPNRVEEYENVQAKAAER